MKKNQFRPRYTGAVIAITLVMAACVLIGFTFLSAYREIVSPPKVPIWRIRTADAAAVVDFNDRKAVVQSYGKAAILLASFQDREFVRCTVLPGKRKTCLLPEADRITHLALCRKIGQLSRSCVELKIGE